MIRSAFSFLSYDVFFFSLWKTLLAPGLVSNQSSSSKKRRSPTVTASSSYLMMLSSLPKILRITTTQVENSKTPKIVKEKISWSTSMLIAICCTASAVFTPSASCLCVFVGSILTCREEGRGQSHAIILECCEKEQAVEHPGPNSNVGQDRCGHAGGIDHCGAIGEQDDIRPRQWTGDNRDVNKEREPEVTEVQGSDIEPVQDQNDLTPNQSRMHQQKDVSRSQEVEGDEVRANVCRGDDELFDGAKQDVHVESLTNEEKAPRIGLVEKGVIQQIPRGRTRILL